MARFLRFSSYLLLLVGGMLEPVTDVGGLEDMVGVREPIEQRGCQIGITEHGRPFGEAQVGAKSP